jgi:hypothetical protein
MLLELRSPGPSEDIEDACEPASEAKGSAFKERLSDLITSGWMVGKQLGKFQAQFRKEGKSMPAHLTA